MKVVVFGASGRIGSQVVQLLRERGAEVVEASPASGIDVTTGEGVADAVRGADVTIDVTNAMLFEREAAVAFFGGASSTIVGAAREAGVRHHVALSIVGADRMATSGYMAGKLAQERAIEEGGVPATIVRATQFIEFLPGIATMSEDQGRIVVPSALMQPVAAAEVAETLVDVALDDHAPMRVEIAGPERLTMAAAVGRALDHDDPREIVVDSNATYSGAPVSSDELVPLGAARTGTRTIEDVLRPSAGS